MRLAPIILAAAASLPPAARAAPSLRATAVARPPAVDGRLDEAAWAAAPAVTSFVQRKPLSGARPAQRTELRVLYDASTIYLGLRMWDERPALIRRARGARDVIPDSDKVTVYIDPARTRERGYYFVINASGQIADGVIYNETSIDGSWDGVWSGAVAILADGWSAELRIPLYSITFQERPLQEWGLAVERYVQRTSETSIWPPIPKDTNTFVSRFAALEGLRGLRRGLSLRLQPYASLAFQLGRASGSLAPQRRAWPNAGLDLRYGADAELALSAALNPDFGQVERDPAVVNLGWSEVFHSERRPFFVADAEIFRTPIALLHTRRIGARPSPPAASAGATIVELDTEARILGALKLSGELGRASYGVLSTVVLPTHARERLADGSEVERGVAPAGHYGVGRLRVRAGSSSSVGLIVTALSRPDAYDAYAAGLDWSLRAVAGWQTTGQLSVATAAAGAGYGLYVQAGQLGAPRWRYWLEAESFSPRYEINDVGYQWRNDMVRLRAFLQHRLPAPWRRLREWALTLWGQYGFNHAQPELAFERRLELWSNWQTRGLWDGWAGAGARFYTLDDREARGGPWYGRPEELYAWLGAGTDSSRRARVAGTGWLSREGQALQGSLDATLSLSLWDRLTLAATLRGYWARGLTRWVATALSGGLQHYLFGDVARDELEARLSGSLGIHRLLTLSAFGQLLHSVGRHGRYRELYRLADGSSTLGPTALEPDADFSSLNLIVNASLRWDLGGGAAATLVYKLGGIADVDMRPARFDLGAALERLRRDEHTILLQASYGWNL
jgi:hypothetical protein